MKKTLHFLPPVICLLALLAAACGLVTYEDEFLWKAQELNLHLDTPLFFRQQMVVAGGLLTWLGTWFTEFFFHPVASIVKGMGTDASAIRHLNRVETENYHSAIFQILTGEFLVVVYHIQEYIGKQFVEVSYESIGILGRNIIP